jgi:hypothetical protein
MPNLTLSITDELKERMDAHQAVKWSSAIRAVIEKKLGEFEEAERLAQKSKLTMADLEEIAKKIDAAAGRHARKLLDEGNR